MHSLLDRSTILAGLVEELRPLLPSLGGALGDLCAGFGRAEAAEQALETAFMVRAAAEMLELDELAEAGRLIETVVPILHEGSPDLLKESRPVVQSLVAAVEQATNALIKGNERPDEALAAARSGVARLQELQGRQLDGTRSRTPDLEAMLATLPDVPDFGGAHTRGAEDEPAYVDAVAESEATERALSPWAAHLAPPGSLPEPVWDESADESALAGASEPETSAGFGDFDLLSFLELSDGSQPVSTGEASDDLAVKDSSDREVTIVEHPVADTAEPIVAEPDVAESAPMLNEQQAVAESLAAEPFAGREDDWHTPIPEQQTSPADELPPVAEASDDPDGLAIPEWSPVAQPQPDPPWAQNGQRSIPPIESAGPFSRFLQGLRNGSNGHVVEPESAAPNDEPRSGELAPPADWAGQQANEYTSPAAETDGEAFLPTAHDSEPARTPEWSEARLESVEPLPWSAESDALPTEATAQSDELYPVEATEYPVEPEPLATTNGSAAANEWLDWTHEPAAAPAGGEEATLSEPAWMQAYGVTDEPEATDESQATAATVDAPALEPAGVPALPEAPQSALEIDPEIFEVFMLEADEVLTSIRGRLSEVQIDPHDRAAAVELRRACHTLKGAANVVGFNSIGLVAKSMEDLLDSLAEAGAWPDEAVLRFMESSYRIVRALIENPTRPDLPGAVAALQADGQALTLATGITPEQPSQTAATAESAAWDQAVEAFFSDAESSPEDSDASAHPAASGFTLEADEFGPAEPPAYESVAAESEAMIDEAAQAELVTIFAAEAEEHLTALSGAALNLDLNPSDDNALAEARRTLHTLKGASGALGLEMISGLCHETESRLDSENPSTAARLLFEAAETLEQMVRGLAATGREAPVTLLEPLPEAALPPIEPQPAPSLPPAEEVWPAEPEPFVSASEPIQPEPVMLESIQPESIRPEPVQPESIQPEPIQPEPIVPEPAAVPVAQVAPAAETEEAPANAGSVRVELGRVDELMNVVGEVVLTRSSLEQRLDRVSRTAEELRLTVARLRRVAQYLEDRYEVAELIRTTPQEPHHGEFDELEMDRYTELHRVSREVAELAADAETTSDELDLALKELDALTARQARLGSDLQDKLMAVRLVPLSTLTTRLHRTVRSVALKQGKEVDFVLQGGETELDKRVIEELGDVLLHLIRNAVDHGVETPEERDRAGKRPTGTLTLRAFREGSEAIIQVVDDGSGVDLARLRQRAELLGMLRGGQDLDEQELLDLMFQPGISTSTVASEVSGRGVGLDVVRTAASRLKGSIEVSSTPGEGTVFTLRLPVVLAVVQAMLVEAGEQPYAIPMAAIERVIQTEAQPTVQLGRTPMIELDGEAFPFAELSVVLGQTSGPRPSDRRSILVVRAGERRIAVAVDAMLDQREVVVKSLGPHLRAVRGVLGAAIRTNGELLLVLNTAELLTSRALALGGRSSRAMPGGLTAGGALRALVVDDSLSVRKVLARSLERDGWEVRQARDGVDALEVLQGYQPNVVLMDIEMPRMDGFELAGILRDVADYGRPPVVMITSRAGDKHRQRAAELDVAGYVVKPYQEPELLEMLRQVALTGSRR